MITLFLDNTRFDMEYCRVRVRSLVTCTNAEIALFNPSVATPSTRSMPPP